MSATDSPAPPPPHATLTMKVHTWLYRATGGRLAGGFGHHHFLLLTTTGRRSGQRYATPLAFYRDRDGTPYVIASNWGKDVSPAWLLNIQANPHVEVELGTRRAPATAAVASSDQRARIWPELVAIAPEYTRYASKTTREIPIVLLHLDASTSGDSSRS